MTDPSTIRPQEPQEAPLPVTVSGWGTPPPPPAREPEEDAWDPEEEPPWDVNDIAASERRQAVHKATEQLKRALAAAIYWDAVMAPETEVDPAEVIRELAEHVRDEYRRYDGGSWAAERGR